MKKDSANVYTKAIRWCNQKIHDAQTETNAFATEKKLDLTGMCFVAVGSIGRSEALNASDLDLIPIARTFEALNAYESRDVKLRKRLNEHLKVKVSKGEQLTKACTIDEIVKPERIGGAEDDSSHLTRRILVLTEGKQIAGNYQIKSVKQEILKAYEAQDKSRGRHILSLCNDIARYYRTLCIEYKPKADKENEDWCTRNLKLRHSRKIWYFSIIVSVAKLSERYPRGGEDYGEKLLNVLTETPVSRLIQALKDTQQTELGRLLETYAFFLEFMSKDCHRSELSKVPYEKRYENRLGNPFPAMKFNSDLLYRHMVDIIEGMQFSTRRRVLDWYLF